MVCMYAIRRNFWGFQIWIILEPKYRLFLSSGILYKKCKVNERTCAENRDQFRLTAFTWTLKPALTLSPLIVSFISLRGRKRFRNACHTLILGQFCLCLVLFGENVTLKLESRLDTLAEVSEIRGRFSSVTFVKKSLWFKWGCLNSQAKPCLVCWMSCTTK